jgi:hypothetical protein
MILAYFGNFSVMGGWLILVLGAFGLAFVTALAAVVCRQLAGGRTEGPLRATADTLRAVAQGLTLVLVALTVVAAGWLVWAAVR